MPRYVARWYLNFPVKGTRGKDAQLEKEKTAKNL
jgi:hypothetical protein